VVVKRLSYFGAAAIALLGAAVPAAAQTGQTEARTIEDYIVRCLPVQNPSPCDMYLERGNPQTGQRVYTLSIAYMPSANRHIMVISVPLGVLIEKGAVIETSGFTTEPMQIRRCDRGGCYVEAVAPQALIDGFKKAGPEGRLKVVGDDDKPYEFPLSFRGFSAAHDYMVEQNRAKARTPSATPGAAAPTAQ
jgi:invasion protein IalB